MGGKGSGQVKAAIKLLFGEKASGFAAFAKEAVAKSANEQLVEQIMALGVDDYITTTVPGNVSPLKAFKKCERMAYEARQRTTKAGRPTPTYRVAELRDDKGIVIGRTE